MMVSMAPSMITTRRVVRSTFCRDTHTHTVDVFDIFTHDTQGGYSRWGTYGPSGFVPLEILFY